MSEGAEKKINWFLWLVGISCLIVISTSFYSFYFKKNYDFVVETACDPTMEACFQRDCSNPDDCPPNGLSDFKRYTLSAGDFKECANEDCSSACSTGLIKCEQLECTPDDFLGESCSSLDLGLPIAIE